MSYPWKGRARRAGIEDFAEAASKLSCEIATVRAVWQVESAGKPFRRDGTLERRYEPHHMPGSGVKSWRESLRMSFAEREAAFMKAYQRNPEAALKATSAGGPQIMGFNHHAAGFPSAVAMFEAMADDEAAQINAFVNFVKSKKMETHFRAKDWRSIARIYNGSGLVNSYSAKMEEAYRNITGRSTPVILRAGASDKDAVRRLQGMLGLEEDGIFGRQTDDAVRDFQRAEGLHVDGVVGAKTWERLELKNRPLGITAPAKPEPIDYAAKVSGYAGAATAVGGAVATLGDSLPDEALTILTAGAVAAGFLAAGAWAFVKLRRQR